MKDFYANLHSLHHRRYFWLPHFSFGSFFASLFSLFILHQSLIQFIKNVAFGEEWSIKMRRKILWTKGVNGQIVGQHAHSDNCSPFCLHLQKITEDIIYQIVDFEVLFAFYYLSSVFFLQVQIERRAVVQMSVLFKRFVR